MFISKTTYIWGEKNLKNLTSLLHGGRKHIFPRWQWHKEGEGDHPQADGEVCQHLDASQEQMKDYKTSIRDPVKAENLSPVHKKIHIKSKTVPLRMDNTLVQSTGRPYNGLPPPTLREKTKEKEQGWKKYRRVTWSVIQHKDSKASVSYTYHRKGWSLGSSAVCRGKSARGRSTPSWWRGQLPPSTLGSLQKCRDLPAHLSRTGNIRTNSRHTLCLHILLQFILKDKRIRKLTPP